LSFFQIRIVFSSQNKTNDNMKNVIYLGRVCYGEK